ncbi:ribosome-binding protein aMBF1, putative translation factor, contains Zn-ribbon and HTH domains [Haladaptatus litoreus]|uniref:Ribosome-binding protein aMBF1, putative translation factor, contains Zn-ribbon and HTH domains n=1 Tax=Haladaptatus litoreus TaxID=553468 RepID=A0A1N6Z427_9EURY|nr:multiprotein-bridging factor 1 family protein [Haladaptatus litoreus]SIR21573.1 ribosome-binding protein aMBF1, putative translation factor, contains Zn-ribbon and HTH domains [Haladaptatus litoreus]
MAKYSTGNSSGGGGSGSCELCGKATDSLTEASVAGAQLSVCENCASHNDAAQPTKTESREPSEQDRKRRAAQRTARMDDARKGDSRHWEEEGTNYDSDPLPYLVSNYGDNVVAARQDAGLQREELADELDIPEKHLLAVEQNRANRAGVGGSVIEALEDHLDVTLSESA